MSDVRGQLTDPELLEVYDYWSGRRGDRPMPARSDIDPLEIPKHLPNLMLIDVVRGADGFRYRYRLVGTRVVAATGEDRTGRFFDEFAFFQTHPAILTQYAQVVERAAPLFSLEPFRNEVNGSTYQVKRLLLPLSADGRSVDMIMVQFRFETGPYAAP